MPVIPAFTTSDEREAEFFKLLKESLEEKPDADIPENLKFLKAGRENLDYEQIGEEDGYVNYIYRIKEMFPGPKAQSVVVKWTRILSRMMEKERIEINKGAEQLEQFKQTTEHDILQRNTRESEELQRMEGIIPGATPKVFWVDSKRYFFIMEDLCGYKTLRQQLIDGVISERVFKRISWMLSTLHKSHHIKTLGQEEFDKFSDSLYKNPMLDQLIVAFFDMAFKSKNNFIKFEGREFPEPLKKVIPDLYDNAEIEEILKRLKESFTNVKLCYLQNDSHPGSFMANDEGDVRILDFEFSTAGNPAKEIGYALGEVVMFYYVYEGRGEPDLKEQLKSVVTNFIRDYMQRMSGCIDNKENFMQYLAGHAGHFMGLRGASKFMAFKPLEGLEQAEANCALAAIRLMKGMDQITTLEEFISQAFF